MSAQQSYQSASPARLTLFFVNLPLPQAPPGPLYPRIVQLKQKATQSVNIAPRSPAILPSPTVATHHFRPSLYGLQREKSCEPPGSAGSKRQTLHMKRAMINWVTDKKRTLVASVVASTHTLNDFLDREMSSIQGEAYRPIPLISPLSAAVLYTPHRHQTETTNRDRTQRQALTERHPSLRKRKTYIAAANSAKAKPIPPPISIERIPVKEALRDREWTAKAKDFLQKEWVRLLRLSNGVAVSPPTEAYFAYTFYVGRGNNHQLVKNCFKGRSHWMRETDEDAMEDVNIVWTQTKVKYLFKGYPQTEEKVTAEVASSPASIVCGVKLTPKSSPTMAKGKIVDVSTLGYDLITRSVSFIQFPDPALTLEPMNLVTHNKLEHNYHLTNKKTLFISLRTYCELTDERLFEIIPVTFHVANGVADSEFVRFTKEYTVEGDAEKRMKGIWIIKPGENTNRGTGITVCSSYDQIRNDVSTQTICPVTGLKRTFILQKYIENPLLINRRKFDIRCFALVTAINGVTQGYFYQEGYLRTSSKEFSLKDVSNRFIHLTNDAVQKYSEDYGKFEAGNKLSYSDLQRYLDSHTNTSGKSVQGDILSQIREIVRTTFLATFPKLNANKRQFSFEVLGYDFMLDASLKAWLIEVNTNPCLEMSSPLLARIIPAMLDNAFRIAVDPYFPEVVTGSGKKTGNSLTGEAIPENKFELIFSSLVEGAALRTRLGANFAKLEEFDPSLQDMPDDDESYEDEPSDDES